MNNAPITEQIVRLDPKTVIICDLNRTPRPGHVKELAASIKATGQTTPILVRPHPSQEGHWEVGAGACRKLACEALGLTVDAIVRNLNDTDFNDMVIIENLQREELDPYEEAAKLSQLVEKKHSPTAFAAKLGKSTAWLKSRMRLTNLSKESSKEVKNKWPLDIVEALADFPPETQVALLKRFWKVPNSAKELREAGTRAGTPIGKVDWFGDERTANGKCGGGGCCATNNDMLFNADKGCLMCMNQECFNKRLAKQAALMLEAALSFCGKDNVIARSKVTNHIQNHLGEGPKVNTISEYVTRSELGTKTKGFKENGGMALVEITKDYNVEVWYFNPKAKEDLKSGEKDMSAMITSEDARPDRVAMLKGKRFMALHQMVVEHLTNLTFTLSLEQVAAFGTSTNYDRDQHGAGDRWEMLAKGRYSTRNGEDGKLEQSEPTNSTEFVTEQIRSQLLSRLKTSLNPSRAASDEQLVKEVANISKWMGFDTKSAELKIAANLPPSKSWAAEVDAVTLNPKKVNTDKE